MPAAFKLRVAEAPVALGGLYERYSPYVARLGFLLLSRHGEVDDLVQATFLEAYEGMPVLHEAHQVRAWLATVAVRLAGRQLRRRRLVSFFGFDDEGHDELCANGASPEERAMVIELYRALERLPTAQRIAWTLRHVNSEPLDEVARLCQCSLATAKRRIAAATAALGGNAE